MTPSSSPARATNVVLAIGKLWRSAPLDAGGRTAAWRRTGRTAARKRAWSSGSRCKRHLQPTRGIPVGVGRSALQFLNAVHAEPGALGERLLRQAGSQPVLS